MIRKVQEHLVRNYWAMVGRDQRGPLKTNGLPPRRLKIFLCRRVALILRGCSKYHRLSSIPMLPSHRVPRQPGSQSRTTFYTASIATFRGVMQKRHHVDDFSHMKGYSPMETVCGLGSSMPMMKMIRPEQMRNTISLVVTCLLAIFTVSGCVMQSTYDAALQEGMTARAELARAKDEERVLARQVSDMELLNADVVREAEGAASALLQAKDDAEQKRQQAELQIVKLQQKAAQATKQQRALRYELTVAKENASALQELIDVYQRKI